MTAETVDNSPQQELLPEVATMIRNIVAASAYRPDATPDMVGDVTPVAPYFEATKAAYLAHVEDGRDVLVTELDRDLLAKDVKEPQTTTGWSIPYTDIVTGLPPNRGYFLAGLIESRQRRLETEEGLFDVQVATGAEGLNNAMTALRMQPGHNCFKAITVVGGKFTDEASVKAATRLEVLLAESDEFYTMHDRRPTAHYHTWWGTPPRVALLLQKEAIEADASGEEERIHDFAAGLDGLRFLTYDLVPVFSDFIDNDWGADETVESRLAQAQAFVRHFADHLEVDRHPQVSDAHPPAVQHQIERNIAVCDALVQNGLLKDVSLRQNDEPRWPKDAGGTVIPDAPELVRAKRFITSLVGEYASHITTMLARADTLQGQQFTSDARRDELIQRLTADLS